jgi:hemolysin activation/secretion protein
MSLHRYVSPRQVSALWSGRNSLTINFNPCLYITRTNKAVAEIKGTLDRDKKNCGADIAAFCTRALFLILIIFSPASAQAASIDPTGRSSEPPTLPKDFQPELPRPGTLLPPVPLAPKGEPFPAVRVMVREIRITGSTVFSPNELANITAPYLNRELTSEDLESLRVALTLLYVNKGYVTSGAILPDQSVADGVVHYQIVEGGLTAVEVEGNRWLRSSYLQRRFNLDAGPPLNIDALQQRLQLLLEDPRIQRLNAELRPGVNRGEGILDVRVEERTPYKLSFEYNNYQSPSVGEHRGLITLTHQNLTGNGDVAMAQYGRSKGLDPLLDFKYSLPLTAYDTTLSYEYRKNTLNVIEQPFQKLNINSKSNVYTFTLRQPVYRTLNREIALELVGERLSNKTTLGAFPDQSEVLTPGSNSKGETAVTALRPTLEFVHRTQNQVIAARSRFSFGVDALGATINRSRDLSGTRVPDGRFFAWLGQFQWVRRLGILDSYLIFRSDLQLANNPLLTLEQIAIGGRYSVRGYRENTMLRDRALITSVESRLPVLQNSFGFDYLELAQFFDFGRGWNTERKTPTPQDISSVGVGFRWALTAFGPAALRPQFELYWGHRLRQVDTTQGRLQDHGIHIQFILGMF